eukprot:12923613-Prorocentrum_lima.AAC.1
MTAKTNNGGNDTDQPHAKKDSNYDRWRSGWYSKGPWRKETWVSGGACARIRRKTGPPTRAVD